MVGKIKMFLRTIESLRSVLRCGTRVGVAWTIVSGAGQLAHAATLSSHQGDDLLKQNAEILTELRQIRVLLERQLKTQPADGPAGDSKVQVTLPGGEQFLGDPSAPWTLIEYTDYQCPFCQQFHLAAFEEIKKKYIDTGKLRFISRDFPLSLHENAGPAAAAARCAAEQGKFWELRNLMIKNSSLLDQSHIDEYAQELGLDERRLHSCVESRHYQSEIDSQVAEAQKAGIEGTPSFVLGKTSKKTMEGVRIVGTMSSAAFDEKFNQVAGPPAK